MVHISTQRRNTMKESGMGTKGVAGEECILVMDQYMKENGMMIRGLDKACLGYVSILSCISMATFVPMIYQNWNA